MTGVKNSKEYQCVGGPMDGAKVLPSEVKEGFLKKGIVERMHDFGCDYHALIWKWAKELESCKVVYKLDGGKLLYSHRIGAL